LTEKRCGAAPRQMLGWFVGRTTSLATSVALLENAIAEGDALTPAFLLLASLLEQRSVHV
jgi:hypothetical protein